MSVLELPLLVGLHRRVGALGLAITFCPTISILENTLNVCIEKKYGCGNLYHRYNASGIHVWVWGIFSKVVRDYRKFEKHGVVCCVL
jgi:hypothetical protein